MLIWADFPSGQRGLYGTDRDKMLNGIWAGFEGASTSSYPTISDDPDPSIGSAGRVLRCDNNTISPAGVRFALPAGATETVGFGFRLWMSALPSGNWGNWQGPLIGFRNIANGTIAYLTVLSTGALAVATSRDGTGLLGQTSGPVVPANSWPHVEIKQVRNAGTYEVRVDGRTVLDLEGLALGANDTAQIFVGVNHWNFNNINKGLTYYKDFVFWDGSGDDVNDFQGNAFPYDLYPDGDEDLQWQPSSGAAGWSLIKDNVPSNALLRSGLIASGETVTIGAVRYSFTSGSVNAGSPAGTTGNPWLVALGVNDAASLENLYRAINASGAPGTTYSAALLAHPVIDAVGFSETQIDIEPTDGLTSAVTCAETGANLAWNASTLTGGPTDTSFLKADATPPAPSIFTMTDLPDDITGVRALIDINRTMKSDGGDCQVQGSLSPNGSDWALGADRPITVANTWRWDVSHRSPASAAPWTPTEVNDLRKRVNRTV